VNQERNVTLVMIFVFGAVATVFTIERCTKPRPEPVLQISAEPSRSPASVPTGLPK